MRGIHVYPFIGLREEVGGEDGVGEIEINVEKDEKENEFEAICSDCGCGCGVGTDVMSTAAIGSNFLSREITTRKADMKKNVSTPNRALIIIWPT